jgi:hypothetical protein
MFRDIVNHSCRIVSDESGWAGTEAIRRDPMIMGIHR